MNKKIIWTNKEVEEAIDAQSCKSWNAFGVSIDSRNIESGDLFIAIKGENFDGHEFVDDALERGAVAAIISSKEKVQNDQSVLLVEDTIKALTDLARYSRARLKGKVICVTGSVGKTSVKEMLGQALSSQGDTYITQGNLNNHLGLPLSLARIGADTDYAVLEIGMNHAGEIRPLTKLAKPNLAIITNVSAVHLEFFESVAQIADAKAEIFEGLSKDGIALLNRDNKYYPRLESIAKKLGLSNIYSFGESDQSNYQMKSYLQKDEKTQVILSKDDMDLEYYFGLDGKYQALNSVGVLAAADLINANIKEAAANLASIEEKEGRGKKYQIQYNNMNITIIDDCYNASPVSVSASLDKFGDMKLQGRRLVALGDMFELGDDAVALHVKLGKKLLENKIDLLFTAGELMGNLYNQAPGKIQGACAKNSDELTESIAKMLKDKDTLLIKGSNGMKMKNIVKFFAKGA